MEKNVISISKKISEKVKTIEVSADVIVPDIKPDIVSIIATNGNTYIYKEEISNSRIRVDGNVDAYIIYLSENGETRSIETTLNFVENIDDDNILDTMFAKEKIKLREIETKVLNERKIAIRASLEVKCEVFENSEVEMYNKFDELEGIEKLEENVKIRSIIGMNSVKNSIKENINIDNSYDIAEILKVNVFLSNYENKISYNKVLAKADVNTKILFLTEDGRIASAESVFPLVNFIDIEKVSENNICNVDYMIRNMLFKPNSKEMHSVSCQIDFEVSCEAFENREISIIQDMYGISTDVSFSNREFEVQIDTQSRVETIKIDEKVLVEDISSIYDVECRASVLNKTVSGEFINYEGETELEIYYEADNKNGLNVRSTKIPFLAKIDKGYTDATISVVNKQFELSNEYINFNVELELSQKNLNVKKINLIENIEKRELEDNCDYTMVVYFVKNGDTIWNISKKFKVSMNSIIEINNLENPDRINVGDRLYIMK